MYIYIWYVYYIVGKVQEETQFVRSVCIFAKDKHSTKKSDRIQLYIRLQLYQN